ncbi:ShlB/FhaC/HecB family hemolysin secretion/activation protein [Variovorax sp.]|uniref:ShlB/FhaC/HecB family hemolysin secretion/activation protein n=1 Tax=Variovorax sp. TaxID=1871043 RepID=UPI000C45956F|nr:ShlB/FhaC/HecB family hemolysin secretion/activation protein [Variovorax sp.]MBS82278.1 hemin-binding protein [Variovorax sp.]
MNPLRPVSSSRRAHPALAAFSVLCSLATSGHAQVAPIPNYGSGDALREAQPPRPLGTPRQPPAPVIVEQPERPLALPAGETLTVRDFKVEGADEIPPAELRAALDPYRGRALSMAEIEQAAGRITALLRDRGYLVARAYVPRQDASAGTLTVRVLIGSYGKLTLKNRSLVHDATVADAFAPLQAGQPVSRAQLERAMLLVGDMPGATLPRLTISPGEAPGTSDFDVEVGERKRFSGYVLGDNQGSLYTGKNRLSAGLDINSPFGIADRLSLNLMGTEGGGLDNGRVAYGFPLTASGLRLELAAARTTYHLGGDYEDLEARGRARTVEATLSYPLLRSRAQNLSLSLNLAQRHLRDEVGAVESVDRKTTRVATFAVQHERWGDLLGRSGYTSVVAGFSYGHLDIDNPAQAALNRAGANTAGDFAHLNLRLAANVEFAKGWTASSALSLQKALRNKNLDGSEQMSISGPNGVKAYREWVSGDNGYLLNAEVRYALPAPEGLTHSVGVFADLGRAWLQNADYTTRNGVRLSDVGIGYQARYGALFGRLQVARAIGSRPQEIAREGRTRVLVQAGVLF